MTHTMIVDKKLTDLEIEAREGTYFEEKDFAWIIDEDTDVYRMDGSCLLKFRKNVIDKKLYTAAVGSFAVASRKLHANRGPSAGELNRDKLPNYVGKLVNPQKYRTHYHSSKTGKLAKQNESNSAPSNIAGYWDRRDRNPGTPNAPCRETAFTRDQVDKWKAAIPYIERCDQLYKQLSPNEWKSQRSVCEQIPQFVIGKTAFSTITVNYSWRTALHKDAGDYIGGMGNLTVIKDPDNKNDYVGGYTGFPQYQIAVNVQDGDFLLMDVHDWHCNTKLKPISNEIKGKWSKRRIKNGWHYNRLSCVMYLRDQMIKCKKNI